MARTKNRYDPRLEHQKRILAEQQAAKIGKPKRKVFGVRISFDQGKNWRAIAICEKCYSELEPPTRAVKEIESGAASCDWCGARNINL